MSGSCSRWGLGGRTPSGKSQPAVKVMDVEVRMGSGNPKEDRLHRQSSVTAKMDQRSLDFRVRL